MQADTLIADKAFDADKRVIDPLAAAGKISVIPLRVNRREPRRFDRHLYKARLDGLLRTHAAAYTNPLRD